MYVQSMTPNIGAYDVGVETRTVTVVKIRDKKFSDYLNVEIDLRLSHGELGGVVAS